MKNYIGRKCKGFRFEDIGFTNFMEKYIGKIGEIISQNRLNVLIQFETNSYFYPISLIEPYLIPESPEIPQLGEGVEMEVSNTGIEWFKRNVIAQRHDGLYITGHDNLWAWKHARPIQEVKKYTKKELVKILGHDFEMV
jgi:hypothetical protein